MAVARPRYLKLVLITPTIAGAGQGEASVLHPSGAAELRMVRASVTCKFEQGAKTAKAEATDGQQSLIEPLLSDLGLRVSLRFRGRFRTPSRRTWIADHFRIRIG